MTSTSRRGSSRTVVKVRLCQLHFRRVHEGLPITPYRRVHWVDLLWTRTLLGCEAGQVDPARDLAVCSQRVGNVRGWREDC